MAQISRQSIRRIAHALLCGLILAIVVRSRIDSNCTSMLCQGDFPAFYSAAVLASDGNWEGLNDQELHARIQKKFWPKLESGFYLSAYPPYVAAIISPLAYFSPENAKLILTIINFIALLLSLQIITGLNPKLKPFRYEISVFALLWYPVIVGAFSGQIAGVNMLLFSLGLRELFKGSKEAKFLAGIFFGLWLIKPQFAVYTSVILLCMGEFICVFGTALVAFLYYILGAVVQHFSWPESWYQMASKFHDLDIAANGYQMVSFDGALQQLLGSTLGGTAIESLIRTCTCIVIVVTALRAKNNKPQIYWLLGPAVLLCSGHALFYDLGLGVIALLGLSDIRRKSDMLALGGFFLASWACGLMRTHSIFPWFWVLTVGMYFYCLVGLTASNFRDKSKTAGK